MVKGSSKVPKVLEYATKHSNAPLMVSDGEKSCRMQVVMLVN